MSNMTNIADTKRGMPCDIPLLKLEILRLRPTGFAQDDTLVPL